MAREKNQITIYDLAREMGVSPSTVSRALNGHKSIGKKTANAVRQLAKKRGYAPNAFAASLRTNKSNNFGVLVSWINRPFISSLISGVESEARKSGYQTIISQSHDSMDLEIENLRALFESRVSALIVSLAVKTSDYSHFELFIQNNIPVVFVDRVPDLQHVRKVRIDNYQAALEATEHLVEQGCTRIAHFGGDINQPIYNERRLGYLAALKKHNLDVDESIILQSELLDATEGAQMSKQVLNLGKPPDGIFCANDRCAVSVIQEAKSQNLRIPTDLAVIGFNNDPVCEIIDPPLSSVIHPAVAMGQSAVQQILKVLDGNASPTDTLDTVFNTSLVIRKSSQCK